MKTWILTGDAFKASDKGLGTWLRDLGFKLIEAGAEINIAKLDGRAAREALIQKGLEVAQVVDPYSAHDAAMAARRQGASSAVNPAPSGRYDPSLDLNS